MTDAILTKTLSRLIHGNFSSFPALRAVLFIVVLALANQLAVAADQKINSNPCKLDYTEVAGLNEDLSTDVLAVKKYASTIAQMLQREEFAKIDCVADQVRSSKERFSGGTWKIHELYGGLNEPVQYPVIHAT